MLEVVQPAALIAAAVRGMEGTLPMHAAVLPLPCVPKVAEGWEGSSWQAAAGHAAPKLYLGRWHRWASGTCPRHAWCLHSSRLHTSCRWAARCCTAEDCTAEDCTGSTGTPALSPGSRPTRPWQQSLPLALPVPWRHHYLPSAQTYLPRPSGCGGGGERAGFGQCPAGSAGPRLHPCRHHHTLSVFQPPE
jgi:hypothetical protein